MINKVDTLTSKLDHLYKIYEEKCWSNPNDKIIILLSDNCITFYYNNDNKNIDEFCLSFSKSERKIYKYLSLSLFNNVLGDVYIYKDNHSFYNLKHKPYLTITINDEDLLKAVNNIVFNQEEIFIKEIIDKLYKKKPFKIYSTKFLKAVDERIEISSKRIRSYKK